MIANRPLDAAIRSQSGDSRPKRSWLAVVMVVLSLLGSDARSAWAGLGGDAASVSIDASALGAWRMSNTALGPRTEAANEPTATQSCVLRTSADAKYSYGEFIADDGDRVREFVAPGGKVFGVAWQGRRTPDLRLLLGSYFRDWHDAVASEPYHSLHRSAIRTSSLVVQIGGAMGFVAGRAWAPKLIPARADAGSVVK